MESENIPRVTFAELADVKLVMMLVSDNAENKWRAYRTMVQLGVRNNSGAMAEARRDVSETLKLLISISEEFRRLHNGCECPTTDEEIDAGTNEIRERLAEVRQEIADAGPVNTDPGYAIDDLRKFLGSTGIQVPEGFDRQDIPGLSTGDGTGFYF